MIVNETYKDKYLKKIAHKGIIASHRKLFLVKLSKPITTYRKTLNYTNLENRTDKNIISKKTNRKQKEQQVVKRPTGLIKRL